MALLKIELPGEPEPIQCGGSIIDEHHILTASHCVATAWMLIKPNETQVFVGNHFTSGHDGQRHTVKSIIREPRYDAFSQSYDYDIAIIELESPLHFGKDIGPICVPTEDPESFNKLTVAGWGYLDANKTRAKVLMEVDVDYIPSEYRISS